MKTEVFFVDLSILKRKSYGGPLLENMINVGIKTTTPILLLSCFLVGLLVHMVLLSSHHLMA